jgi:hypothetical protein
VKSWVSVILAVIFLGSVVVFNIRQPSKPIARSIITPQASPTSTPIPTLGSDECRNESLRGTINLEPAAGNLHGSVKLTNISQKPCVISLNNKLQLSYLPTVKNVTANYVGTPSAGMSRLFPNASFYATLSMPNGPQCKSSLYQAQIGLSYQINTLETIIFTTQGKPSFMMNVCTDPIEATKVDISPLSIQPGP